MTSSGFGTFYPKTFIGKIVSQLAAWTGQFLFVLSVASLSTFQKFTKQEE